MVSYIAADIGNANIKGVTNNAEVDFPHKFTTITMQDYHRITSRLGADTSDYFIVNGQPYVIGRSIGKHSNKSLQAFGQRRYTRNYYGVLAAILMTRLFGRSQSNITFMGSFPPSDEPYAIDLQNSVLGEWVVENDGNEYRFNVRNAYAMDEPLAGYYNVVLNDRGEQSRNRDVRSIVQGVTLMIDGGGYTTDVIAIDPQAKVDYSTADSYKNLAAHSVLDEFIKNIESAYRTRLKNGIVSIEQYTNALRTGMLDLRGAGIEDVSDIAREFRNQLYTIYEDIFIANGGATQYNTVIFTGGVSGLLELEILDRFEHNNFYFADKTPVIHRANARGLMASMRYWQREGLLR